MIRKLQRKIVLTTTLTLALLVLLGNLMVHVAVVRVCGQMTDHILKSLAENEEVFRSSQQGQLVEDLAFGKLTVTKEELFSLLTTPLYAAELDTDGTLLCFEDLRSTSPLDPSDMEPVLRTVSQREAGSGSSGGFRYYKEEKPYGYFVVLANNDLGFSKNVGRHLLRVSLSVSLPVLLFLFCISILLSRYAISPAVNALKRQKQFISDAGHELKTPLTAISGFAELMENHMVLPEDVPDFAGKIHKEASRLLNLVNDIIKVSQLDDKEVCYVRENIDLLELAMEIRTRLEPLAEKQQVTVTVSGEHVQYLASRQMMNDLIYNLMENGMKYNKKGGNLWVEIGEKKDRPRISVRDTGIGIPMKYQSRVFERFFRVDKSHSKQTGGTGLGLSIVKHVVEYCGGYIEIHSTVGEGTEIITYL